MTRQHFPGDEAALSRLCHAPAARGDPPALEDVAIKKAMADDQVAGKVADMSGNGGIR
jgi:hypothetical protein